MSPHLRVMRSDEPMKMAKEHYQEKRKDSYLSGLMRGLRSDEEMRPHIRVMRSDEEISPHVRVMRSDEEMSPHVRVMRSDEPMKMAKEHYQEKREDSYLSGL